MEASSIIFTRQMGTGRILPSAMPVSISWIVGSQPVSKLKLHFMVDLRIFVP